MSAISGFWDIRKSRCLQIRNKKLFPGSGRTHIVLVRVGLNTKNPGAGEKTKLSESCLGVHASWMPQLSGALGLRAVDPTNSARHSCCAC